MWLVRESDEYDLQLFDAMRTQTYAAARGDAALEAVLALGLRPLDERTIHVARVDATGATVYDTVIVEEIRRGRTRAVLFSYGGRYHLWSLSSAHRVDERGHNEFTQILCEVLLRIRPVALRCATVSRLVRSKEQAAYLLSHLSGTVDQVVAGEMKLDMAGDSASTGWILFTLLGMSAALERDWIVSRLLVGRVAKWRRGEWAFGAGLVPFGYIYDTESKRLVPEGPKRAQVREMLVLLGSTLPPKELLAELGRLGVELHPKAAHGKTRSVAEAVNPTEVLAALYRWVPVWTAGEYLLRVANTVPTADHIAGLEITRAHEGDAGEIQMLHNVELPPGGWADSAVLVAAQEAALRSGPPRGSTARLQRPLSNTVRANSRRPTLHEPPQLDGPTPASLKSATRGLPRSPLLVGRWWTADGFRYEFRSETAQCYTVTRVPLPPDATTTGTGAGTGAAFSANRIDAVPVARVAFDELHRGFALALSRACREGISAFALNGSTTLMVGATPVVVSMREAAIRDLKVQMKHESRREQRAYAAFLDERDPDRADELKLRSDELAREVRRTRARLLELESNQDTTPARFQADVEVLLTALTNLRSSKGSFTAAETNAFQTVVPDFRIGQTADGAWLASATVRLPSEGKVTTFGPITWPIRVGVRGAQAVNARIEGDNTRRVESGHKRDLRTSLAGRGVAREAVQTLLRAPFPELAQLVLHHDDLARLPEWVSAEWREPHFAAHIASVYLDPEYVGLGGGRYITQSPERQAVLDTLASLGGHAAFDDIVAAAPGLRAQDVRYIANPVVPGKVRPWSRLWDYDPAPLARTVTALRCACGAVARVLARVPEVPGDLLCECGRVPTHPAFDQRIIFPPAYRSLAMSRPEWRDFLRAEKVLQPRAPKGQRRTQIIDALMRVPGQTALQIARCTGLPKAQVAYHLRVDPIFVSGECVQPEVPTNGPPPVTWSVAAVG